MESMLQLPWQKTLLNQYDHEEGSANDEEKGDPARYTEQSNGMVI